MSTPPDSPPGGWGYAKSDKSGEKGPPHVVGVLMDDGAFVLVRSGGNHYWHEWASHTFDGACAELEARERSVGDPPMEVVEVVVRRRATVTSADAYSGRFRRSR